MLLRLRISNFALIEDVELTFDRGMSVLTGETGAGKSVIIAALALALGERAEREHIRHGTTRAVVEAVFSVERMSPQYKDDFADYITADKTFTVTREIDKDGGGKVKINGDITTVARLKELTAPLAEVLGQHSSRLLLDEDNHMFFLDGFASIDEQREEVGMLFDQWERVHLELRRVRKSRDEIQNERELLLFQQKEIEDAALEMDEEERLNAERKILDSARGLMESADIVQSILGADEQSPIDALRAARKEIERMARIDDRLHEQVKLLTDLEYQIEDVRGAMEKYGASIEDNPQRLEEINERLDEIYRVKQKYGGSVETTLKTLQQIKDKLRDRPDTDQLIRELEEKEASCREAYADKAVQLSDVRRKAARYLQRLVVKEMAELAIADGQFDSEFVHVEHPDGVMYKGQTLKPNSFGLERCRFLFSANPGEPLKSLVKTASGGEISRLLLALKGAELKNNELSHSLLVFDEVDTGIGGQTAIEVGRKIKRLAEKSQVIVITHLHQIARLADHHYLAEKHESANDRVTINVTRLDGPAVHAEIDRMVALPDREG